jgi:hypothetical protein
MLRLNRSSRTGGSTKRVMPVSMGMTQAVMNQKLGTFMPSVYTRLGANPTAALLRLTIVELTGPIIQGIVQELAPSM